MRTPDGREVYDFPGSNQKLFVLVGGINLAWVVFMVLAEDRIPMLGVALFILAVVGWYFMGKGAKEAKAQFEGDARRSGEALAKPLDPVAEPGG